MEHKFYSFLCFPHNTYPLILASGVKHIGTLFCFTVLASGAVKFVHKIRAGTIQQPTLRNVPEVGVTVVQMIMQAPKVLLAFPML